MRRATVVTAMTAALSLPLAPALADTTVVVPGLAFPDSGTYLTWFGCTDLYHADTRSPQIRIARDQGGAPAGTRSFGVRMPGDGTASGPVFRVDSVADTTVAGFTARSDGGGAGVAYVWFVTPDLLPGEVWSGRADLSVGPQWTEVDAAGADYTWTRYQAVTGEVLEDGGSAGIDTFTAEHGDGPGYLLAGLGCDGEEFALDALEFGSPGEVTTYDLEGMSVATTITASATRVERGGEVTLKGSTVDADGEPVGATLVLESRPEGAAGFSPVPGGAVHAGPDGDVTATVSPKVTTAYRWARPATGYADGGHSGEVTVRVAEGATPSPTSPSTPTNEPSQTSEPTPSNPAGPSNQPSPTPPPPPTPSDTPGPTGSPSPSPSQSESTSPSPSSTPAPTPSEGTTTDLTPGPEEPQTPALPEPPLPEASATSPAG
ncbi:hypothetical protein ACFP3Q_04910 [Nocardioides sp. GCM10027113]|uniref:hypothetical protein n=1 Tax=unclassified Nocardioides TaxID=2615069 RepID=UPI003620CA1D